MSKDGELAEIASYLANILASKQAELNYSLRKIEEISGVSRMSVQRILNGETSIAVDKFCAISRALGLVPWQVLKQAEASLAESLLKPEPEYSVMSREERIASVDRKLRDGSYLTKAAAKEWDARTEIEQNPFYT